MEIEQKTFRGAGLFFIIAGALGLLAAFELTVEKFLTLANPGFVPNCNIGILVSCSTNLASSQGSAFGFPNPLIGLVAWPVVITIGVALVSKVSFPRWMWIGFNIGTLGAFIFVAWLIYVSLYQLGVLCPWCMLTWSVTIPTFWVVTLNNLKEGRFGTKEGVVRIGRMLYSWVPLITVACYVIVIILAQVQLNAIPSVIRDVTNYFSHG